MRAVNLLPATGVEGRKRAPVPVLVGCGGMVLVTAFLALSFLSASSKVGKEKQELEAAQLTLSNLPVPPPPSPVVAALPQQRQDRVGALSSVLTERVAWDRVMREVSEVVPADVWLVNLDASAPATAAADAGANPVPGQTNFGFSVNGCTYSQDAVARFLARLSVVPDLQDMTLTKSDDLSSSACAKGMFEFTLSGNLHSTGTPS
jgi:Tfp pilus assembly protein PilN